jgi:peptidyl-tRNA hydrolase, PTH1 family
MYLVVGLGNPGKKYAGNRHNVGFMAVDRLRDERSLPDWREKFSGVFARGTAFGDDVMLLKPMTYMNVSGDSVQPAAAFVKVDPTHVVVLHDELDLAFGDVRLKQGGGHAGHNGLRSIIQRLGTPEFLRVRIGIGRPPADFRGDVADYVLNDFDGSERAELPDVLARALAAVQALVEKGPAQAQNVVNTRK